MTDTTENINNLDQSKVDEEVLENETQKTENKKVDIILRYLKGEQAIIDNEIHNNSLDLDSKNDREKSLNDYALNKVSIALERYIKNIELLTEE